MSDVTLAANAIPESLFTPEYFPLLSGILRGVEKESLRVTPEGTLAKTPHPKVLGAALTHPQITTDFSEALLEFITPPSHLVGQLLKQLHNIHAFTYHHLGEELLWVNSMPCMVGTDQDIPLAQYGTGYRGKMKTVYRMGLGHRYGRVMQTVAGVHYNFSLPRAFWAYLHTVEGSNLELKDYIDSRYFGLIRNFRRYYWLLLYCFGASPAVCKSFVKGREHDLLPFGEDDHTLHYPYATTLRMGDLGYQSSAQEGLFVCYNSRKTYVNTLGNAIFTPYSPYQAIGKFGTTGEQLQLNTSLLQIENEFYSAIRPKRTAEAGETALTALCRRGVEYIEVRCLDLDPFHPLGVSAEQVKFLDTFLLYCLFKDSPLCDVDEFARISQNHRTTVRAGRDRTTVLVNPLNGAPEALPEWGAKLLSAMTPVAELLDAVHEGNGGYGKALTAQLAKVHNPELTPSASVLKNLADEQLTFAAWGRKQARAHKTFFSEGTQTAAAWQRLTQLAETSLVQQAEEERTQAKESFEQYLVNYYRQYENCCQKSTGGG